jgi:hypothetical protein
VAGAVINLVASRRERSKAITRITAKHVWPFLTRQAKFDKRLTRETVRQKRVGAMRIETDAVCQNALGIIEPGIDY